MKLSRSKIPTGKMKLSTAKEKKENFNATKKIKRRSIVLLYLELQPVGSSFCDLQRWW
jgi:hypothetical protein